MSDGAATTQGQIFIFVVGSIIVAVCVGLVTWVKKKVECQDTIGARTLRQSKAMILMAQRLDSDTNRLHQNAGSNLAEEIEALLKDQYGNL